MVSLEFHGAAGTVTGSNYIVRSSRGVFAVDCGMFQGPDVEALNLKDFDYNASEVDFTMLTHAHIDHSGMLPKLVKHGFSGDIYATNHTIQIATLLLLDSAKIQENNYKRGLPYGKYSQMVALVYNTNDALETIDRLRAVEFDSEFEPKEGIKVRYIRAGHILGAASIEVEIDDVDGKKTILFSGDIGRENSTLIESYDHKFKSSPDYVLIESLYGGQFHPNRNDSVQDLLDILNSTIEKGGNVYIPCFAVERTQEILRDFKIAKMEKRMKEDTAVFLDSPLAQRVSAIYSTALESTDEAFFNFSNLKYVKKHKESLNLARKNKQVVIAGSGMADGGRIVEHLVTGLENPKNSVIFVGYQAEGTMGRQLVEGAKELQIGKNHVRVKAQIHYLHGFSAHGDTSDYLNWFSRHNSENLKKVFLIHAEPDRAEAMKQILSEKGNVSSDKLHIPVLDEKITL
jgi:metallo-beta-lactamase family protein